MPPVLSSDDKVPVSNQTSRPRHTTKLSSCLTDANNHATPKLQIHQKTGPTANTNMTTQNASKRNATDSDLDGLQPEHTDDEGATKDKPSQGNETAALCSKHAYCVALATGNATNLDGLESEHADDESTPKDTLSHVKRLSRAVNGPGASQMSSRAASVYEVPDKEFDSPVNGQVGQQAGNEAESASAVPRRVRPAHPQNEVDGDGFFDNVHVQPVDELKPWHEDKTQDVSAFFGPPKSMKSSNGKQWIVRDCEPCHKKGQPCEIMNEATTCRCHLAYKHKW
ncbi:hypothetical protein OG21DRAFT_1527217 [Imleria badia]|nr:hypothetical protein OG21DRAFT_1527217 [Imleria badia]